MWAGRRRLAPAAVLARTPVLAAVPVEVWLPALGCMHRTAYTPTPTPHTPAPYLRSTRGAMWQPASRGRHQRGRHYAPRTPLPSPARTHGAAAAAHLPAPPHTAGSSRQLWGRLPESPALSAIQKSAERQRPGIASGQRLSARRGPEPRVQVQAGACVPSWCHKLKLPCRRASP